MKGRWIKCSERLPPESITVLTKIEDTHGGSRNETKLKRINRLWFFSERTSYVYYEPTHRLEEETPVISLKNWLEN